MSTPTEDEKRLARDRALEERYRSDGMPHHYQCECGTCVLLRLLTTERARFQVFAQDAALLLNTLGAANKRRQTCQVYLADKFLDEMTYECLLCHTTSDIAAFQHKNECPLRDYQRHES